MSMRTIAVLIVLVFAIVALFGLPLTTSHYMGHEIGCPFMLSDASLCANAIFEHLRHWLIAFAAIGTELLVFALILLHIPIHTVRPPDRTFLKFSHRMRAALRPTLIEELFSQGVLNPKAP